MEAGLAFASLGTGGRGGKQGWSLYPLTRDHRAQSVSAHREPLGLSLYPLTGVTGFKSVSTHWGPQGLCLYPLMRATGLKSVSTYVGPQGLCLYPLMGDHRAAERTWGGFS